MQQETFHNEHAALTQPINQHGLLKVIRPEKPTTPPTLFVRMQYCSHQKTLVKHLTHIDLREVIRYAAHKLSAASEPLSHY